MDKPCAEHSSIKDLVVIDLPHADTVKVGDWEWKRQHFFAAENCDRQLLIGFAQPSPNARAGSDEELPHVPDAIKKAASRDPDKYDGKRILVMRGADAYKHLLRVACGMLDKQPGEKATIEGIRANWNQFLTSAADEGEREERKAKFGRIVRDFVDDSSIIRAKTFEDRQAGFFLKAVSTEPAVAARNLIRPGKRDSVLVICEKDGITANTFKVLDNCASTLHLTHPDPKKCDEYANQFRSMGYKANVEIVPYEEAMSEQLGKFRFVFNCQPMDNGGKDASLIEAWRNNSGPGATLIHLKGNPLARNTTSEAWKQASAPGVVFIEDIHEQKKQDLAHNTQILEHAETAIANCVTSRRLGRRPVDTVNKSTTLTHLLDYPDAYEAFVEGAARKAEQFRKGPVRPHAERNRDAGGEASIV